MSSIGTISNSSDLFPLNITQISTTQEQAKVHHHHKPQAQDLIQLSGQSNQDSANASVNPLDSLVTNGTITQAQEGSIMSAFMSKIQTNQTLGTYSAKQTNPISSLVANGTITQAQASSITDAFKSASHTSQDLTQISDSQGKSKVHHHHAEQTQGTTQTGNTPDTTLTSVLNSLESKGTITQDQETSIENAFQTQL